MNKICLDVNVFLDIFLLRKPFYGHSANVFQRVEREKDEGFVSAISFPIIFYILRPEYSREKSREILREISGLFTTAPVQARVIQQSLDQDIPDFEDAVQYQSALAVDCDFFITRNKTDFPRKPIGVLEPEEYLALLSTTDG